MVYPATGSILNSNIHTGLSTQISILVNNQPVGALQKLTVNQNRGLERVKEIGMDGTLEIVPNSLTTFSAQIDRMVFDRLRLPEAFARGFINIKSQLLPFDILILDRSAGGPNDAGMVKHQLINCWFKSYSPSYGADNFIISESAAIEIEDIITTLGNTNQPAALGGERGVNYQINTRERQTDSGLGGSAGSGFRGTMDVDNLINAAFEN